MAEPDSEGMTMSIKSPERAPHNRRDEALSSEKICGMAATYRPLWRAGNRTMSGHRRRAAPMGARATPPANTRPSTVRCDLPAAQTRRATRRSDDAALDPGRVPVELRSPTQRFRRPAGPRPERGDLMAKHRLGKWHLNERLQRTVEMVDTRIGTAHCLTLAAAENGLPQGRYTVLCGEGVVPAALVAREARWCKLGAPIPTQRSARSP